MQIIRNPEVKEWGELLKRPMMDTSSLNATVKGVLEEIRKEGDRAVKKYTLQFDKVLPENIRVSAEEIDQAEAELDSELKKAIEVAADNIRLFHEAQKSKGVDLETSAGVRCWQIGVGIQKVGLYIPGGSAPLFSTVLMLAIPARIAGCKQIVLCSPPDKQGKLNPAILFAAKLAGVTEIFKIGGVQAIGAMAYGTETVAKVYKIFGPGNQYVMAAKQLVGLSDVAIDMPAGPSEVAVMADKTANPAFVAADLLSQAEHGPDSQVILFTNSETLVEQVQMELDKQLKVLPRKEIALKALAHSRVFILDNENEMVDMVNQYAPEHLIISLANYRDIAGRIVNAGSVFLGNYTPESAGDYASGTNHTLPTNGWATAYSGVNLDSFQKKITFQEITADGLDKLGPVIETMAHAEELYAHRNAVSVRLKDIRK
ncbi:MAG: histidinol dehydrogenase [Bacteroidota bacterium]|nr:histidinol dehydrogenase [Bacteroidota bacterium]